MAAPLVHKVVKFLKKKGDVEVVIRRVEEISINVHPQMTIVGSFEAISGR